MQTSATLSRPVSRGMRISSLGEPVVLAALLAALGIGLLLGAFAFEYIGGIKPCHLCLGQRLPWPLIAMTAGVAMLGLRREMPAGVAAGAFVVAFVFAIWSAYLAAFHVGVEWKWWPGPPSCTGIDLPSGGKFSANFDASQIVRCDEIAWSLFGLSLAGYNFIFSLVAIAAAGAGTVFSLRKGN